MDVQTLSQSLGGVWRNGHGQAACPVCQPERRRDQNALSLRDGDNGKVLAFCFKSRCSFRDIARAAGLPRGAVTIDREARREAEAKRAEYSATKLRRARSLWAAAGPIGGTHAERYLRGRGITCPLPASLRFMPDLFHGPTMSWACAMVADVSTGGVHRTFFDKRGKRLTKNAKLTLGACAGGHVALSESNGPLVVCEGIETGLALASGLLSAPATIWAALSTSGMMGLDLPPKPHEMIIGVDGDDAGQHAANNLATRATALGWSVSLLPAPDGRDWNDVLMSGGAI